MLAAGSYRWYRLFDPPQVPVSATALAHRCTCSPLHFRRALLLLRSIWIILYVRSEAASFSYAACPCALQSAVSTWYNAIVRTLHAFIFWVSGLLTSTCKSKLSELRIVDTASSRVALVLAMILADSYVCYGCKLALRDSHSARTRYAYTPVFL